VLDSVVAALFGFPPLGAACTLPGCALRGIWGDATMTIPGGTGTLYVAIG
jgi:hypothetical protein